MDNNCYFGQKVCPGPAVCRSARCLLAIKDARVMERVRALSNAAPKADTAELMKKALKLQAVLFKDWCDRMPTAYELGKTNDQLYDDFLVSLQSDPTAPANRSVGDY